tara:strand:+ start:919 stop:1815 length:897 start_codon:yes stop_codon:yes gene_type:complete
MFFRSDYLKIFISIYPRKIGGGSNTFSYNFNRWLIQSNLKVIKEKNIKKANLAIVIADKIEPDKLRKIKNNCFIIHRLDEHLENNETGFRKEKHEKIKKLNQLADVTVYQSKFVFENMHPYLGSPSKYEIIHNGGMQDEFYPSESYGKFIGHVTWGVGGKKRLDVLYNIIRTYPKLDFLLVGRHAESEYNFQDFSNVKSVGTINRKDLLSYYHQMQFLLFPSENDPCPNTVIEAMLSGIPICYNKRGGTIELVKDCGVVLDEFSHLVENVDIYRQKVLTRNDLDFDNVGKKYLALYPD